MRKIAKLMVAAAAIAGYLLAIRYVAPSHEPYFIIGIALVGLTAWLYGIVAGLTTALILIPVTHRIYNQFDLSTSYLKFALSPAYITLEVLAAIMLGRLRQTTHTLEKKETRLAEANEKLQAVLLQVQELGGVHNICSSCKKILSDGGEWMKIDVYLQEKTKMEFSHGICPGCAAEYNAPQKPETTVTDK